MQIDKSGTSFGVTMSVDRHVGHTGDDVIERSDRSRVGCDVGGEQRRDPRHYSRMAAVRLKMGQAMPVELDWFPV